MAKDPGRRYQTPGEVIQALAPFTGATPVPVLPVGTAVQVPSGPTQVAAVPGGTRRRTPGRRRALALGVVAVAGLLAAGGLARLLAPRGPGNAAPPQPAAAREPQVLLILPSRQFWFPDYENVAEALNSRHVRMRTASSERMAHPDPAGKGRGEPAHDVPVDYLLTEVPLAECDAVIVGGGEGIWEYLAGRKSHADVERVIAGTYQGHRPVAALCMGPAVLAEVRVDGRSLLQGRRATAFTSDTKPVRKKLEGAGALWADDPVVVDGPIITAGHWDNAGGLVDALVAALRQGQAPPSGK
jgi:putative intracellular protease/amidase